MRIQPRQSRSTLRQLANHLPFTFAKDLDTRQGLKLDNQFQIRFLHIF